MRLVQPSTIPSLKTRVHLFESLRLSTHEAMKTVYGDRYMYVPVQNCEGASVLLEDGKDVGLIRITGMIGVSMDYF